MIDIKFDTSELVDRADQIATLDSVTLAEMRMDSVSIVALTVREKSIDQTVADLNLTRDYVAARIARSDAKGRSASARITSQVEGTTLQRFGAEQATKQVNWTNERIQALGHEFDEWPGWTRRTGDASRGIEVGEKADGVAVDVNRKGAKTIKSAFTMPLKNGNGFGVFKREGGSLKHRYGPSVYQVFRRYITANEQAIADTLRDEFIGRLDTKLQEITR